MLNITIYMHAYTLIQVDSYHTNFLALTMYICYRTCYSRQYYYYTQRYTAYHYASYSYSYSCGWWDWRRCRRTVQGYTASYYVAVYNCRQYYVGTIEQDIMPIDEQEHTNQQAHVAQDTQDHLDLVHVS